MTYKFKISKTFLIIFFFILITQISFNVDTKKVEAASTNVVNCCALVPGLNCDANGRSEIGSGNVTLTYDFVNKTVSGGTRGTVDISACIPDGRMQNFAIQFDDNHGQAQILSTTVNTLNGASNTFDFVSHTNCSVPSCNWWTNLFTRSWIDVDISYDTASFPSLTFPSLTLFHHYGDGTGYIPNGIGIPDSGFPPTGACGVRTDSWDVILDDTTDKLSSLVVNFGTSCGYSGTVYEMFNVVSFETYAICGDGVKESTEACDNVSGYNYTEDCPYGATNCCHVAGTANECTVYGGAYCGDGDSTYPFSNSNVDFTDGEECDAGSANGTECVLPNPDEPGTCAYCKSDCTKGFVASGADVPLVVTGGLVALGENTGGASAIELQRNIIFYSPTDATEVYYQETVDHGVAGFNNNMSPAEAIYYDPRYLDIYREFLGGFGNIQFLESGVQ